MKKLLIVLLSAMFVLSGLTFVFADDGGQDSVRSMKAGGSLAIGGDARIRGTWQKNYALDSDADADMRRFSSRVRLYITGKAGNGIEARTKMTVSDGTWDNKANTVQDVGTNYAYLHIPIGSIAIDGGLMERSFGNKFHTDYTSEARDTLQVSTSLGDTGVGAFIDKISENTAAGDENLEDYDNWGVYVNHSAGNIQAGVLLVYENDKTTADDENGTEFDVYVNADVGSIGIAAELAYTTGDIAGNENADGDAKMGGFVSAAMPMGQMAVSGAIAYATNGYVADSHFTPTVFLGTDQVTAIADFGATLAGTPAADDKVFAIVGSVDYDVNDDMSAKGTLAYVSLGGQSGKTAGDDASFFELDASMSYKIADNASYGLAFGYLAPSDLTADDDAAIALSHNISIYF